MKSFVFVALVLCFIGVGFDVKAQFIGFRGGYQTAYTNNNGSQIDGSLGNFYLGVFKNKKLGVGDLLRLHTGIEYMQNGHRANDANFRKINYISVPVGLRVKIGPLFAQGGVNGNFRISEKYEINGVDALTDTNKTSTFDLPAHVGLGFKILILEIEARYHQGFMDVNNGNKNSYLQIGLAIEI